MERESDGSVGGTRQLARYLTEQVTQEDWAEIVKALVASAKQGNASAARLLMSARFGAKRWLSSVGEESDKRNVSRRKSRLLKILKTNVEGDDDDEHGTPRIDRPVRAG